MRTNKGHDVDVITVIKAVCKQPGCNCVMTVRLDGAKTHLSGEAWRQKLGELIWHEVQRADADPRCTPCAPDNTKADDVDLKLPTPTPPPTVTATDAPPDHPEVCKCPPSSEPRLILDSHPPKCGTCRRVLPQVKATPPKAEPLRVTNTTTCDCGHVYGNHDGEGGKCLYVGCYCATRGFVDARTAPAQTPPTPEEVDAIYAQASKALDEGGGDA